MPRVEFTGHLKRFFPELAPCELPGSSVAEVLGELDQRYPGLRAYIVDERGALRQHVNVFVGSNRIVDRQGLSDAVRASDTIHILQALSGG